MSWSPDMDKPLNTPPPSYNELFGSSAPLHSTHNQPVEIHRSSHQYSPVAVQDQDQTQDNHNQSQNHYNQHQYHHPEYMRQEPFSFCPPGLQPLLHLNELLIYPSVEYGRKHYIKNTAKEVVYKVKKEFIGECCGCCDPASNSIIFHGRTVNKEEVFVSKLVIESFGCCFTGPVMHLAVKYSPDVAVGQVKKISDNEYYVTNPSGDLHLVVKRNDPCCDDPPYEIRTPGGALKGWIGHKNGLKYHLSFNLDLDVRIKVLLLSLAVFIQHTLDSRRRSRSS